MDFLLLLFACLENKGFVGKNQKLQAALARIHELEEEKKKANQ